MASKLVVSIVQSDDADQLLAAIRNGGYASTVISSMGGFLRQGNVTIFVGTEAEKVPAILAIIRRHGHARTQYAIAAWAAGGLGGPGLARPIPEEYATPRPESYAGPEPLEGSPHGVQVGGAVVFVLDVDRIVRF